MTAAPWDVGPCLWPDDAELDRQLAEADRAFADLHDRPDFALLEHGRSPARAQIPHHRPIADIEPKASYL
ncbi:hypothetical protein [Streptomyces formicae]|uniref:hypothetical protein n=1 Tax=Streptomyces formicae TaxID=1616117 RepID=UPI0036D20D53